MNAASAAAAGSTLRIAMWSGPRNLSTAMMRSFGNRGDCAVLDEPFYAAYLKLSGVEHPMRDAILDHHETDWRKVAELVCGPAPDGAPILYQKHMTHHMLPEIGRGWMHACRHAFLIRHPARVLASYAAKREAVDFADIGLIEQTQLFDEAAEIMGRAPPVVDADALLADPRGVLRSLCEALGIFFSERMLSWPPGGRPTDGIWAAHWYDAVNATTGFGAVRPMPLLDDPRLQAIEQRALPLYRQLAAHALS
jgi:hypothetical protein